jgi:hypothetical protein
VDYQGLAGEVSRSSAPASLGLLPGGFPPLLLDEFEIDFQIHNAVIAGKTTAEPFKEYALHTLEGDVVLDDEIHKIWNFWCVLVHVNESADDSDGVGMCQEFVDT